LPGGNGNAAGTGASAGLPPVLEVAADGSKTFMTIQAALDAAEPCSTEIQVYSGTYDENLVWNKAVDILEAPGQTAVLRPTAALAGQGSVLLEVRDLPCSADIEWNGIDIEYASTQIPAVHDRWILKSGSESATATFRNLKISATLDNVSAGRVVSCEEGFLVLENCSIELEVLPISGSATFETIVGAYSGSVAVRDSIITGFASQTLASVGPEKFTVADSIVQGPQQFGVVATFGGGTIEMSDATLRATNTAIPREIILDTASTAASFKRCLFEV
jgi:hypothetical protein